MSLALGLANGSALFGFSSKFEAGSAGRHFVWLVFFVVMLVPLPLLSVVKRVATSQAGDEEAVELLGSPEREEDDMESAMSRS